MRARVAVWLGLLAVLGGCGGDADAGGHADAGSDAPTLPPTYGAVTIDGDSVQLADLRGSPVLLNVWATWCAPCRQEIPELQALHERHREEGLRVVGVTVDARAAGADVERFIEEFGMTYDIWLDPDQTVMTELEAVGVPVTVLIDAEGRTVWRHMGVLRPGDPGLEAALRDVLG